MAENIGINEVDCSQEAIDRNWSRLIQKHNVVEYSEPVNAEADKKAEDEKIDSDAAREESIQTLKHWLSVGMDKLINSGLELNIDVSLFDSWLENAAQMVHKYNINLSAFEIIAKYKVELCFIWSTVLLAKALVMAQKEKNKRVKIDKEYKGDVIYDDEK
jgi:hypothetical protein